MKHPESLLLPLMMFADYFLTVAGAIQREKKYALHFRTLHYELNPIWQKAIAQKKWFNPRHAILTIILSTLVASVLEFGPVPDDLAELFLGLVLVMFAIVLARHINNLLLFGYLNRNPDQISGEVVMSHRLVLAMSLYQAVLVMLPLLFVAALSRSPFALGGFLGAIGFVGANLVWIRKAGKSRND